MTNITVDQIARVCHEANRAYCLSLGDTSQVHWEDAPEWQKDSARNGVELHLTKPHVGASGSHNAWMDQKAREGWTYGPVKDVEKKQHPCFRPFHELPPEQQFKDFLFQRIVRCFAIDYAGAIVRPTSPE